MAKMICFHLYHWILSSHYLTYTIVKLTLLTYSKTIEAVLASISMKSLLCLQAFLWFMTSFNITLALIDLKGIYQSCTLCYKLYFIITAMDDKIWLVGGRISIDTDDHIGFLMERILEYDPEEDSWSVIGRLMRTLESEYRDTCLI